MFVSLSRNVTLVEIYLGFLITGGAHHKIGLTCCAHCIVMINESLENQRCET